MAKVKKTSKVTADQTTEEVVEETVEETTEETTEAEATEEAVVEASVTPVEKKLVTNITISIPSEPDALPGPELKMETPPTLAEVAITIEDGQTVEIVGIRGFEGIVGKVTEVRPDGYIVIKSTQGTYAAPKANVKKVA